MMLEHNQIWYTHDLFTANGNNGVTAWSLRYVEVKYGRKNLKSGGYEVSTLYAGTELNGYQLVNFWNLESPSYKYTLLGWSERLTPRGEFQKKQETENE